MAHSTGVNSVIKKHLLYKLLIKTQIYYLPVFIFYTKIADGNVMMENAVILINTTMFNIGCNSGAYCHWMRLCCCRILTDVAEDPWKGASCIDIIKDEVVTEK